MATELGLAEESAREVPWIQGCWPPCSSDSRSVRGRGHKLEIFDSVLHGGRRYGLSNVMKSMQKGLGSMECYLNCRAGSDIGHDMRGCGRASGWRYLPSIVGRIHQQDLWRGGRCPSPLRSCVYRRLHRRRRHDRNRSAYCRWYEYGPRRAGS